MSGDNYMDQPSNNNITKITSPKTDDRAHIEKWNAVMIDIETLSLADNAAIIAIGAVEFAYDGDRDAPFLNTFYVNCFVPPAAVGSFNVDYETVMWWMKQDDKARAKLQDPAPVELPLALESLGSWMQATPHYHVWTRGSLDWRALNYAAQVWQFDWRLNQYMLRDARTLDFFVEPAFKQQMSHTHLAHDALEDATKQARTVMHALQRFPQVLKAMADG